MQGKIAIGVNEVQGAAASKDGHYVVMDVVFHEGSSGRLLIPTSKAKQFLTSFAQGVGKACQVTSSGVTEAQFNVEWWEVSKSPDTQSVTISFRLPGGMVMAYRLDREAGARLAETLVLSTDSVKAMPTWRGRLN